MSGARRGGERGAALVFAIFLILVLTVVGTGLIRYATQDRIASAKMVVQGRALTCAEAGLQYARRLFGCTYRISNGWNDYLNGTRPGRYDPALGDVPPIDPQTLPIALRGDGDLDGVLDAGADLDGDGVSDFLVSIRDDDDERPVNQPDDRARDNNLIVVVRSECTNPIFAVEQGGVRAAPALEAVLTYIPTNPDYGTPSSASNSTDAATGGNFIATTTTSCEQ